MDEVVNDKFKHRNPLISREQSLAFLKKQTKAFYDSLEPVECPILENAIVHFTAQGFYHLVNESNSKEYDSKPRDPAEQYLKLMHLQYAPYIIKNCSKVDEIRPCRKKVKDKWKDGLQYELSCEIEAIGKVSIVIEKIGNGNHKFLSVFPKYSKTKRNKKRPEGRS